MYKKVRLIIVFGLYFSGVIASENFSKALNNTRILKSILKKKDEKIPVEFGVVPKEPLDKDYPLVKRSKKIDKSEEKFLIIPLKIIMNSLDFESSPQDIEKEKHTELNTSELRWLETHLSLSGDLYLPSVYDKLEIKINNLICDKFGNQAFESFKEKQKSWSCDNCIAIMHNTFLRRTGFSEIVIAHNRCKRSVKNALQVAQEFKDPILFPRNVIKRD